MFENVGTTLVLFLLSMTEAHGVISICSISRPFPLYETDNWVVQRDFNSRY